MEINILSDFLTWRYGFEYATNAMYTSDAKRKHLYWVSDKLYVQ